MLKHRAAITLAAAAFMTTTLVFTASAAANDVQADAGKSVVCNTAGADQESGKAGITSQIRTDENGRTYFLAEDGSKVYISWTEEGINSDGSIIFRVVADE